MEDGIVIEDEEVVRLAEFFASEWDCTPDEAVYRVLVEKRDELQSAEPPPM